MICRGNEIIMDYLDEMYKSKYPSVVFDGICNYLTNQSMLAYVALHMGLKDIVLSAVIKFVFVLIVFCLFLLCFRNFL